METEVRQAVLEAGQEVALGYAAGIEITDDLIRIDTRISRDPSRSRNGGEYFEWLTLKRHPDDYEWLRSEHFGGNVLMRRSTSCELVELREGQLIKANWSQLVTDILALATEFRVPVSARWELVNPARCEVCGESAKWHLFDGTDHYVCDRHDWYKRALP